jgi:phytoene synthase
MLDVTRRRRLPPAALSSLADAYGAFLKDDGLAGPEALEAALEATSAAAFRLAARIVGGPETSDAEALIREAGLAYGRARLAVELPQHLARGRRLLGRAHFGDLDPLGAPDGREAALTAAIGRLAAEADVNLHNVRAGLRAARGGLISALLPAALVEPYFRLLQRAGRAGRMGADLSPLGRVTRLWLARRRGCI